MQALTDSTLFTGDQRLENQALLIQGATILDLVPNDSIPDEAERIPLPGCLLAPGLIDLQVNGGGNVLFNATPTKDGVKAIAAAHRRFGTTRILPTCITDAPEVTRSALEAARAARREDPGVLGIHIEGPHITRAGIHPKAYLRPLGMEDIALYEPREGETVMLTLAPEIASTEAISALAAKGVIVSVGHTDAPADCVEAALRAGAKAFTHLLNGMGGIEARVPGPSGVGLVDQNSWCGLIFDAVHVAPLVVRLALAAKPRGKIFAVSDAMPPAGAETPQDFLLVDKTMHAEGPVVVDTTGAIGGSALTLLQTLKRAIEITGIAPDEALRMGSTVPAELIGKGHELGRLAPGFKADIVALSPAFDVKGVWVEGQRVD